MGQRAYCRPMVGGRVARASLRCRAELGGLCENNSCLGGRAVEFVELWRLDGGTKGSVRRMAWARSAGGPLACCQRLREYAARRPRARACWTAWVRVRAPSFWYRCRWWVLTVCTDRYSCSAISRADRLVGR